MLFFLINKRTTASSISNIQHHRPPLFSIIFLENLTTIITMTTTTTHHHNQHFQPQRVHHQNYQHQHNYPPLFLVTFSRKPHHSHDHQQSTLLCYVKTTLHVTYQPCMCHCVICFSKFLTTFHSNFGYFSIPTSTSHNLLILSPIFINFIFTKKVLNDINNLIKSLLTKCLQNLIY